MTVFRFSRSDQKVGKMVHEKSFFLRILISVMILLLITLLLFTSISATKDSELLQFSMSQEASAVASNISSQFETALKNTINIFSSMKETIVQNVLTQHSISSELDLIKMLRYALSPIPFADNAGFYFVDSNKLYMSSGKFDPQLFARGYAPNESEKLVSALHSIAPTYVSFNDPKTIFSCMYVCPMRTFSVMHIDVYFVCTFTNYSISNYINLFLPKSYHIATIVSPEGDLLYNNPSSPLSVDSIKDNLRISVDNNDYIVGQSSSASGFKVSVYVKRNDITTAYMQYSPIVNTLYTITGIACTLLLVLCLWVIYAPVQRIVNEASRCYKVDKNDGNEIAQLGGVMRRQHEEGLKLHNNISKQNSLLVDYAYEHLLLGGKATQQETDLLHKYMPSYIVLVSKSKDIHSTDLLIKKNSLQSSMYVYDHYLSGLLALVCRVDNPDKSNEITIEATSLLGDVDIGVSDCCNDISQIHDRFLEAAERLKSENKDALTNESEINEKNRQLRNNISTYLEDNFLDPNFSITAIADYIHLSEYTTSKLHKQIYGEPFRHTINAKRVDYARELLVSTDKSINVISQEAGFTSPSYFIKVFRDFEKITPAKYRELAAVSVVDDDDSE